MAAMNNACIKGLSNGTLKTLKVDLCFQLEMLRLFLTSSSELSLREALIGLIMFAVIKHLNGTHYNMRHESQSFSDMTFGEFLFSFFSQATESTKTMHTKTHTD